MNGTIIVNQIVGHNQYKIDRLKEEFNKLGVSLDVITNNGTIAEVKNNNTVVNLPKTDFVLYLDKDIYLARLLERSGYRLFNRADFIKMCDDKMLTFIYCSNLGIKMPDTFAGPLVYQGVENPDISFLDKVSNSLGFPMIVKKVYGSLGEGIYIVKTKEELVKLYKNICHSPLVFQKYVPSKTGRSVRVLIIDGKVFGCFARINPDDFRSNFGNTATSEKIENPSKYYEFAQQIADKLKIEYAGIDLLDEEDGNPVLCEINSNAFFEEFEKVTGLNVAEEIAKMVIKKVK